MTSLTPKGGGAFEFTGTKGGLRCTGNVEVRDGVATDDWRVSSQCEDEPAKPEAGTVASAAPSESERDPSTGSSSAAIVVPSTSVGASAGAAPSASTVIRAPKVPDPVVKLIEPGAEPREVLRVTAKAGAVQKTAMRMTIRVRQEMGGETQSGGPAPTIRMPLTVTIKPSSDDNLIAYDYRMDGFEVDPSAEIAEAQRSAMQERLKSVGTLSGSAVMTRRGQAREATLNVPPTVPPEMRQLMEGARSSMALFASPFPAEAVGKGAKWEVSNPITNGTLRVQHTATYELVERKGNLLQIKMTFRQTAPPQTLRVPGESPANSPYLKAYTATGEGTGSLDLTQVLPLAWDIKQGQMMHMLPPGPQGDAGKPEGMKLFLDYEIRFGKN